MSYLEKLSPLLSLIPILISPNLYPRILAWFHLRFVCMTGAEAYSCTSSLCIELWTFHKCRWSPLCIVPEHLQCRHMDQWSCCCSGDMLLMVCRLFRHSIRVWHSAVIWLAFRDSRPCTFFDNTPFWLAHTLFPLPRLQLCCGYVALPPSCLDDSSLCHFPKILNSSKNILSHQDYILTFLFILYFTSLYFISYTVVM